ncbi:MAG TPA: hypothetical protein DCR74_07975 [Achromobacter sp.]|nr:hypothetical protein [Achromobacter sp.]
MAQRAGCKRHSVAATPPAEQASLAAPRQEPMAPRQEPAAPGTPGAAAHASPWPDGRRSRRPSSIHDRAPAAPRNPARLACLPRLHRKN